MANLIDDLNLEQFKDEVIKAYPKKVARKRAKSIVVNDPDAIPVIQARITSYNVCYTKLLRPRTQILFFLQH